MTLEFHRPEKLGRAAAALALFVALFVGPAVALAAHGGYLGVHLQDLDDALKAALDLEDASNGVLVSEVVEDSPADEAGLQRGDVIVEFDGAPTKSVRGLTRRVRRSDAGETIRVELRRKGKSKTIEVTLGEAPSSRENAFFFDTHGDQDAPDVQFFGDGDAQAFDLRSSSRGVLGVSIEDLNEDLGRYFGTDEGVLVMEVNEDSAAEEAGMKAGDVILAVDGETVESSSDLYAALSDFEPGDTVKLDLMRDQKKSSLEVELGEGNQFSWVFPEGNQFRVQGVPHGSGPARLLERLKVAPRMRHRVEGLHHDRGDLESELQELREQLQALKEQLNELEEN